MSDLDKLSQRMKADWDRRIKHDYRFWMSDGQADDLTMWQTGERDLKIMLQDLDDLENKVFLDLGCGVGRLVRPASKLFSKVIGLDVSAEAINKAKSLIESNQNIELIVGNGHDLVQIDSQSVDVAMSYAALTSMPTKVISSYLRELWRVIKIDGVLRLQVYLGRPQSVNENDTLYLRCYQEDNFQKAISLAGFNLEWKEELVLPFKVSIEESGIIAMIVSLKKAARAPESIETIAKTLLPTGEEQSEFSGSELEYWMSIQYAKEQIRAGKQAEAEAALKHAIESVKQVSSSLDQLYKELETEVKGVKTQEQGAAWDKNLAILVTRFGSIAEKLRGVSPAQYTDTVEGPIILLNGQSLDHPNKPQAGAKAWVDRLLNEKRFNEAKEIVVFGFAGGYHIEELIKRGKIVSVIEPSVETVLAALKARDLTNLLSQIKALVVEVEESANLMQPGVELAIRPQTQSCFVQECNRAKALFYETRGVNNLKPMISVLGPLQGGTLPIAGYTAHALANLKQRERDLNVSGFNSALQLMDQFVREEPRQKVMQGNFIELISQLLIEHSWEKPFDILICMAQAPISGRALNELRKRGVITVLWFVEDYLRFTYWKSMAQYYDFVFTIQKGECLDLIKKAGAGEVHYIPTACDPMIHAPLNLSVEERKRWGSPISFVGAGYYNRQQVFASFAELPFKIWGTEWPTCRPFDQMLQEQGRRLAPDEYVKIFNATDININLHSSVERDDVDPFGDFINPRTFELAACGAFQLVDERTLLPELFEPGKEIITFRDKNDLREKIDYYLRHPEERQKIAEEGRRRALRDHTYDVRIKKMLSIIYGSKYEPLAKLMQSDPWHKMIQRSSSIDPELKDRCQAAFDRGEVAKLDALIADIHAGKGKLTTTEQKLLFLHHIRRQIINMTKEEEVVK